MSVFLRVIVDEDGSIPPCQQCGACCQGWEVDVYFSDLVRDRPDAHRLLAMDELGERMRWRGEEKRCVALRGSVLGEVSCSAYEDRPEVCSTFPRGGTMCLKAIARAKKRR